MNWVYQQTADGVWTVGFYTPSSQWHGVRDFESGDEAAAHMRFLNGGADPSKPSPAKPPTSAAAKPK